jgi:hypothetical protein
MSPLIYKLGNFSNKAAFGDDSSLAFLVNWTSPIDDPKVQISQVTDTGKEDARALGALIADRYDDIVNSTGTDKFRIWTASAARDEVRINVMLLIHEGRMLTGLCRTHRKHSLRASTRRWLLSNS